MPSTSDRLRAFFDSILHEAVAVAQREALPLYTFAFYHDHESAAVSVCMDTEVNSDRAVRSANAWSMKYFINAIDDGDLKEAALFQANVGRNLSLGDFALVNVARKDLAPEWRPNKHFYIQMIKSVMQREGQLARLSPLPERLLFCSSTANDEVGVVWSYHPGVAGS